MALDTYLITLLKMFGTQNVQITDRDISDAYRKVNVSASKLLKVYNITPSEKNTREHYGEIVSAFSDLLNDARNFLKLTDNSDFVTAKKNILRSMIRTVYSEEFPMVANARIAAHADAHSIENTVVDVTDVKVTAVGGLLSLRLPMSMKLDNGSEIEGFATVDSTFNFHDELEKAKDKLSKYMAENSNRDSVFSREYIDDNIDKIGSFMMSLSEARNAYQNRRILCDIASAMFNLKSVEKMPEDEKAQLGKDALDAFWPIKEKWIYYHPDVLSLNRKEDVHIAARNCAMTKMAELMGTPNLLAKSVKIKMKDGETEENAVFMEKAKGIAISETTENSIMTRCSMDSFDNAALKEQLANLQVLDFLCLNVDRHMGNILYDIREINGNPVVTGIQGIDNDLSFGCYHLDYNKIRQNTPNGISLEDINVIPERTANTILAMRDEELSANLSSCNLGQDEIEKTLERLHIMQEKIRKGFAAYSSAQVESKKGEMQIVKDGDWRKLPIAVLGDTKAGGSNLFRRIKDALQDAKSYAKDADNRFHADYANVFVDRKLDNIYTPYMNDLTRELNSADPFWIRSSDQFKLVKESLSELSDHVSHYENTMEWKLRFSEKLTDLKVKSDEYLNYKGSGKNNRERERIKAVDHIRSFSGKLQKEIDQYIGKQELLGRFTDRIIEESVRNGREITNEDMPKVRESLKRNIQRTVSFQRISEAGADAVHTVDSFDRAVQRVKFDLIKNSHEDPKKDIKENSPEAKVKEIRI